MSGSAHRLWFAQPARRWGEGLVIGNGRLGACLWGSPSREVLDLNEDTFWSGAPSKWTNPQARGSLTEVRRLFAEGRRAEAQALVETTMAGRFTQAFLPLARMTVSTEAGTVEGYRRCLDLADAEAESSWQGRGGATHRRALVDAVDAVLVWNHRGAQPTTLTVALEGRLSGRLEFDGRRWLLVGEAPAWVAPHYLGPQEPQWTDDPDRAGCRFAVGLDVATDGALRSTATGLVVEGARHLTLRLAAATSFAGRTVAPHPSGVNPAERVGQTLDRAAARTWDQLVADHRNDHRRLYDRCALDLATSAHDEAPTDQRLARRASGQPDPGLDALAFHYGRYLLIASSRPETQPAHLQGLWNVDPQPAWSCNYTTNINLEMNYWPAEVANLADCAEALVDYVFDVAEAGVAVARDHYGARGWTAHHNLDLWAHPIPAGENGGWFPGSACHVFWPLGGAWLVHPLWEHWEFSQDRGFLERLWPILRGAAVFGLDWLVDDGAGGLTTVPSTSPENRYLDTDGAERSVDQGTTCDLASLVELFTQTRRAARVLGEAEPEGLDRALRLLVPHRIGPDGRLLEWSQPYAEPEPGHRHVSHLYGLYPGHQIEGRPDLEAAATRSLEARWQAGGGGTGWSLGWLLCLWARLGRADRMTEVLDRWFAVSVLPNLLDLHPSEDPAEPFFQIDGNFGVTAGLAEALVQSGPGWVRLLPAVPTTWGRGRVRGLRARGGLEVDVSWADGRLVEARLVASVAGSWRIETPSRQHPVDLTAGQVIFLREPACP